jgi:hypothetical protein
MTGPVELLAGVAVITASILLICFRLPISRFMQAAQRALFGRLGYRVARVSPANSYIVVACVGILIGVFFLIQGAANQLR